MSERQQLTGSVRRILQRGIRTMETPGRFVRGVIPGLLFIGSKISWLIHILKKPIQYRKGKLVTNWVFFKENNHLFFAFEEKILQACSMMYFRKKNIKDTQHKYKYFWLFPRLIHFHVFALIHIAKSRNYVRCCMQLEIF